MNTNIGRYLKPALGALLLFVLISGVATVGRSNLHMSGRLAVENKARYFLGETPTVTIAITNTKRSPQTLKEAEYQKFSLEMTGIFENDTEQQKKTIVYDGSWDIPKAPKPPGPGETHVFEALGKREPKFVKLALGESTTLVLDLSKTFGSYLGVGKYKMIVKSEDGQKAVKEFEVYFDDEKSVAVLAKMLESDDESERNWAVFHLAKFNRTRFVALLEALAKSGNEKQRDFALGILARIKAGHFGPDPALKTNQSGEKHPLSRI